jgi:hypothetical protein
MAAQTAEITSQNNLAAAQALAPLAIQSNSCRLKPCQLTKHPSTRESSRLKALQFFSRGNCSKSHAKWGNGSEPSVFAASQVRARIDAFTLSLNNEVHPYIAK